MKGRNIYYCTFLFALIRGGKLSAFTRGVDLDFSFS